MARKTSRLKIDREIAEQLYDPKNKLTKSKAPFRWLKALTQGIAQRSDVRNPGKFALDIWKRLPAKKRREIIRKDAAGKSFRYDLPLPKDHPTKGPGTVRMVQPFELVEVQVNVGERSYENLKQSGLFENMRRQDGSLALVKRCKSKKGNCNIFVDR